MNNDAVRLFEFVSQIDAVVKPADLVSRLTTALAPFGVTTVSVNLIQRPGADIRPRSLLDCGWHQWSDHYGRRAYQKHDPAVRMLLSQTRPFAWSDALAVHDTSDAREVMAACREMTGAAEGFVVPIRESDGALLTAAFCGEALDLGPDARQALHLAGYYFATRGRELVDGIGLVQGCPLTERQLECLRWVHVGKSDFEIAAILGRSPRTVHNHVEAAKAAMGVSRRSVAAFDAWRRGWLL